MRIFLLLCTCCCLYDGFSQGTFPIDRFTNWQAVQANLLPDSLYQNIDLSAFNLDPSGQQDCSLALNSILNQFATDTIRIHFPAGQFLFTNPIQLHSLLILEGEGAESTHFIFDLGGSSNAIQATGDLAASADTLSVIPLKNDSVLICPGHQFQENDWIYLSCQDAALVSSNWALGTVGQLIQVKHFYGDTLVLSSVVRRSYTNESPCIVKLVTPLQHLKLRCFSIERIDDTAPEQSSSIAFNYVVNSEVLSLFSRNCTFAHLALTSCSNVHVAKNYFTEAFDYGEGGRAYGVVLQASTGACRIEDNLFKHLRHAILMQSGANGNVAAFNFSSDAYWTNSNPLLGTASAGDLVLHGNYVYSNLFEQNCVNNIVIDNSHGANGPDNLFYRNRAILYGLFFSDQTSPNQLFIGNEVTNTALPYSLVNYNLLGAGQYQFANNNKGTIVPSGTSFVNDSSFAYSDQPDFVPQSMWLTIGDQPTSNFPIPAQSRFLTQSYFATSCGQTDAGIEVPLLQFKLFPNPATAIVNVQFSRPVFGNLLLYSLEGRSIYSMPIQSQESSFFVAGFPKGIYFIQLEGSAYRYKLFVD